jgi:opacity protein-like surface antigen
MLKIRATRTPPPADLVTQPLASIYAVLARAVESKDLLHGRNQTSVAQTTQRRSSEANSYLMTGMPGCYFARRAGTLNGSSLRERINAAYGPAGPFISTGAALASSHSEAVGKDLRWFSTVRGRAGFTWDRLFIYGTAGLAVAEYASSTNVTFGNDQFFLSGSTFLATSSGDLLRPRRKRLPLG